MVLDKNIIKKNVNNFDTKQWDIRGGSNSVLDDGYVGCNNKPVYPNYTSKGN